MANRRVFERPVFTSQTRRARSIRLLGQCMAGCGALAILTYGGFALGANSLTIGFLFNSVVISPWLCASASGRPRSHHSLQLHRLTTTFCRLFTVSELPIPKGWVALGVFQLAAVTVSRLSAREIRHAREAAIQRKGMAQLYELSRCSLLLDMHMAPGPQLAVLIHRIFGAEAVALFDLNLGRQDRMGEWEEGEEDLAKQCYFRDATGSNAPPGLSATYLARGPRRRGRT
jgi:hypothetical protein